MKYLAKFPSLQEITPVFSLILFIVFTWTIFRMLFQIPSWLYSHSKSGIFSLAAYVFSFALVESILMLVFILIVCLLLPRYLFKDRFIAQGSLVVVACSVWALVVQFQRESLVKRDLFELMAWVMLFILSLLLITFISYILLQRFQKAQVVIEKIVDRMIVFAWIYVPVGLVSIVIVIVRNII